MYNTEEANRAVQVIWQLLSASALELTVDDIAVIAPFRHQVKDIFDNVTNAMNSSVQVILLRKQLRAHSSGILGLIRVGMVEHYQVSMS